METILNREGAQTLLARNAAEGLQLVGNQAIDVLFTDLRLPDESGLEVLRKSLQVRPRLAAVLITGYATLETAIDALRLGACDYVTKPITRRKIVSALDRAVGWKRANKSNGQLAAKPPAKTAEAVPYCAPVSAFMRGVLSLAEKIAPIDVPVLIQGETGVGKKFLGRIIHRQSGRADGPCVHVACATLSDSQLESELFAGPHASLRENPHPTGLVEQASGGTLLLEDVGDLPLRMQIKLLDVIDRGWFPASGRNGPKSVDVRVIATTSCDLEIAVADGRFHRGFYDNLNLAPIRIPALRERPEDIKAFASYFVERLNERRNGDGPACRSQIADEVWNLVLRYPWPGNVRQLASVITRATLLDGDINTGLRAYLDKSLPPDVGEMITVPMAGDLKEIERHVIREVVRRQGGNKAQAARALGMHRRTLYRVLENGKPNPKRSPPSGQPVGSHG